MGRMPHFAHTVRLAASPERVFAVVDDPDQTAYWLEPCTGVDVLDEGPRGVGTRLRYHYKRGRQKGSMDGKITAREQGRRLSMDYADKLMLVRVDFVVNPVMDGTTDLTQTIDISPKGLAKLMGPLITLQLPGQTRRSLAALADLIQR